jgi:hypothetical protein
MKYLFSIAPEVRKYGESLECLSLKKLEPDAGPDVVQGGPTHLVSSNRKQRRTREGRGPARPVPRGTRASGHAPSGQRVSQC